jgi:hypothetical protein
VRRLIALATFQILAILGWASYHEHVWATAPTFRLPLRPRDPFDLVRGRYFILNPQDTSISAPSPWLSQAEIERFLAGSSGFHGRAKVGFCPAGEVYRVCALARPDEEVRASARFWCKGYATITDGKGHWDVQVDLGLSRFFIPNRLQLPARENEEGWELEVSYRTGQSPLPRRLFFRGSPIDLR